MESSKEHISNLLIDKITGMISPEDDLRLNLMLDNDPEVQKEWESLKQKFSSTRAKTYIDNIDSKKEWLIVSEKLNAKKSIFKISTAKIISAAAILIIVGFVALRYFKSAEHIAKPHLASSINQDKVRLSISTGETISLTGNKQIINIGDIKVLNNNKALSYSRTQNQAMDWMTLSVPAKFDYKITLADGTEVWLNSVSTLKFPTIFAKESREVYLEGEGFFKVAKNKNCPFIVHTPNSKVQVLGTTFNVNTYHPQSMVVSLLEGKVSLHAKGKNHVLNPGHQAVLTDQGFNDQLFNQQRVLGWMDGEEYFNNLSLTDIGEILKRCYGVKVFFEQQEISNFKLSGVIFKNKPIELFLNSLETSSEIKTEIKNNTVHIFY
ncbi:FecR family protein [Pedobacter nyackensis]|uniref:FecR family protein n=1 Tax=Pedobacter nyackensis TaxID=475255 RepID=A0A1W2AA70_9SPHI|nr:FecR family protein [Pedobacter nyackensis]SMC57615.1 FecR family protein [Pedobacter nyackensis]